MSTQNKNFFFTSVPGTDRFLSGDEPTQAVMEDFADSVPFKLEETDTATELQQGLVESATQTEYDNSIDNNGLGYALFVRPSFIKTAFAALETLLQTQIDTINSLIVSIQGDISIIQGEILTIQGDITTLQGDVTTIQTTIEESMPIGAIIMYGATAPPNADWVECDGSSYATGLYPDLFSVVGTEFGGGAGNFNVPDMREKFIAGYNSLGGIDYATIGQGAGANSVQLQVSEIVTPAHNHGLTTGTATININGNTDIQSDFVSITTATSNSGDSADDGRLRVRADDNLVTYDTRQIDNDAHAHYLDASTSNGYVSVGGTTDTDGASGGVAAAHENRPDFMVFPYFIKAQ